MHVEKLSVSAIKSGHECPQKLFFSYRSPFIYNAHLCVGRSIHKAVEEYMRYKANHAVGLPLEKCLAIYRKEFKSESPKVQKWHDTPEKVESDGEGCFRQYFSKRLAVLFPLVLKNMPVIEYPVYLDIKNKDKSLRISGTVDLVTSARICVDHKKSGKGWQKGAELKEPQAYLYPYMLNNLGIECKGFEFNVAQPGDFQCLPVQFDTVKLQEWLSFALKLQEQFETEKPECNPRSFLCSKRWCEFWDLCPGNSEKKEKSRIKDEWEGL